MVAVISSANLGLLTSNGSARGAPGAPGNGQSPDQVFVNTTTGNLVVQQRDETLAAVGLDLNLVRTYNSQGFMDDDNGDNWRLGFHQRVYGQNGPLNTAGSTVRKVFGDGADVLYTYDDQLEAYVSTDGDGAHDTLRFSGGQWTWQEGSTRLTETYSSTGQLLSSSDSDGHTVTYGYNGSNLLSTITDESGQVTTLTYSGTDLIEISVTAGGAPQVRTRYAYDSEHRLSQVIVDLTPTNGFTLVDANSDGLYESVNSQTYVTTYTYDGDGNLESITHGDGSSVSFGYQLIDGSFRVVSITDGLGRTTLVDYQNPSEGVAGQTADADPGVLSTTEVVDEPYSLNTGGLTTPAQGWATASLMESATGAANDPSVGFDANGNGIALWRVGGDVLVRRYDRLTNTWSAQQVIDSRTNTVSAPSLSVDPATGNAIAAWVQSNGTANSTYASRYTAATNTWSTAVLLETSNNAVATAADSVVTSTDGTRSVVAWLQTNGTANDVYVARWDGTSWAAAQLVDSGTAAGAQPSISIHDTASGTILVTWQQSDGTANSIYVNGWTGASWSGATLIESSSTAASLPVVRGDNQGNAIFAWAQGNDIKVRRYNDSTGTLEAEIVLDSRTNNVSTPALAVDRDTGNAIVAWVQSNGSANSTYARRYTASTNTWSAAVLLETTNVAVSTTANSLVAAISGDRIAVAWLQTNDLYASLWDGSSWSGATLIESASANAAQPSITIDPAGNVGLWWQQSDGTANSIYQRRYQRDTTPYYLIPPGATWQSIANALYGINSPEAGSALQTAMGSPSLTAGTPLFGLPAEIFVATEQTVAEYYEVQSGDTWADITLTIYGTNDPSAVAALQAELGDPILSEGLHLTVPLTLSYGAGATTYLETYVTDALGNTTTYIHDPEGRLRSTLSPAVNGVQVQTDYDYDEDNNLISVTEDVGGLERVTTFEYDPDTGNLTRTRDAAGNSTRRFYSATNQLLTETVYLGADTDGGTIDGSSPLTTHYIYDSADHVRFAITPGGQVTEYRYNLLGQRTAMLVYDEATFSLTGYDEDTSPNLTQLTTWAGTPAQQSSKITRTDYTYDFRGMLTSSTAYSATDATGAGVAAGSSKTQYVYDQRGQLLQTIAARGSANTPNATNPNIGYATTFTYDGLGRLLTAHQWNSTGVVVQTETHLYDDIGNRTTVTDAGGLVTTVQYDATGRMVSVQTAGTALSTATTQYKYDEAGRLRYVIDPTGVTRHQLYDDAGRKIADIDADGSLIEYVYDASNLLVKTVRYSDALTPGQLSSLIVSGAPADVSLDTLKAGLPTTAQTGRGRDQITRNVYDGAGRLVYVIDAVGAVSKQVHDGASRVTSIIQFALPVTIASSVNALSVEDVALLVNEADTNNRVSRNFYDVDGNLRGTLDAEGYLVESFYDTAGRITKRIAYATPTPTEPAGIRANGTLDQLRPAADTTITPLSPEQDIVELYFYDGQDRRIGILDGEGYLTDFQYDASGNVIQKTRYDTKLTYAGQAYTTFRDAIPGVVPRHTTTYQYDGANRLIFEQNFEGTQATFGYDPAGRRTRFTEAAGTSDERTTQVRYDALGRVIRELSGEGTVALAALLASNPSASQTQIDEVWDRYGITHAYDLAGRRISSTTTPTDSLNGTTVSRTLYYYDGDGQLRFTVDPTGGRVERKYNALGQVTEEITYFNELSAGTLSGMAGGLLTPSLISTLSGLTDATRDSSTKYTYELSGALDTRVTAEGSTVANDYTVFGELYTSTVSDVTQSSFHRYTYDKRGLLRETEWNPATINRTETKEYDAFGRVKTITDQYGQKTETHYDRLGRTLESFDALGNRHWFTYDAFSRTLRTYDAYDHYTQYDYNDTNRTVTMTTPEGIVVTTQFTRTGQTLNVIASGNTTTYTYDDNGNILTVSDNLGGLETRAYDTAGREITQTDARNVVTRLRYDAANRLFTRTVEMGGETRVTTYEYDGQGRVERVTEPGNRVTTTSYDRDGRIKDVIVDPGSSGALNLRTHYDYDTVARTVTITEGYLSGGPTQPHVVRHAYDVQGRRISETVLMQGTAPLDLITEYRYDANDNLVRRIDAENRSTWYVYDANQRLQYTVDALGGVTESIYDKEGRAIAIRQYAQAVNVSGYGSTDRIVSLSPTPTAADRLQQFVYDRDGRERYSIDAAGTVTQRLYDSNGNVIRNRTFAKAVNLVGGPTQLIVFAKDVTVTAALTAVESALVNATNSLTSIASDDHVDWAAYDVRGQRVLSVDGLGYVVRFQYDAGGNVVATTEYATALGSAIPSNVTGLTATVGGLAITGPGGTTNVTITTDANRDRVTRTWYDAINRVRFVLDAEGYLSETRYADAARSTKDIIYAARNIITGSENLAAVAAAVSAAPVASNVNNQPTTTYFDAAGRVTRIEGPDYVAALNNYEEYGYDAVGNKVSFRNKKGAIWTYQYDANNRLITETTPPVAYTVLDRTSTSLTVNSSLSGTGPLVTKIEYDRLGNVRFRYEAYGTSQERKTEYRYDAVGRQTMVLFPRVEVYSGGAANFGSTPTVTQADLFTEVTYDALGNAITSRDVANSYSHKGYDSLGRVIWELDSERYLTEYKYDAFGNVIEARRVATPLDGATGPAASASRPTLNPLALPTTPDDRVLVKRYDRLNHVYQVETPATYHWDSVTETPYQIGGLTSYQYNAFGQVTVESTALDPTRVRSTHSYYDRRGLKTAQVDGLGYLTVYEHDDSTGDLTRQVEYAKPVGGPVTTSGYGSVTPSPAQTTFSDASGYDRETVFAYDVLNRKTSELRVGRVIGNDAGAYLIGDQLTTYGYDYLGNQTRVTQVGVRNYNTVAQVWQLSDAHTYTYYDALGRITAIAEPARDRGDGTQLIPLTTMRRDAFGNLVEQVQHANGATSANLTDAPPAADPAGQNRVSRFFYDTHGNAIQSEDATGADRFSSYNERGELAKEWQTVVNPGDNTSDTIVTLYVYDSLGQRRNIIEPQRTGGPTVTQVITYNAFGEVTSKSTSGLTGTVTYEYDLAGNVWRTNADDGVYKVYLYDRDGNATLEVKARFRPTQPVNLAASGVRPDNVVGMDGTISTETVYDLLGRVTDLREPSFLSAAGTASFNAAPSIFTTGGVPYLAWTAPTIDSTLQAQLRIDGNLVTVVDVDGSESGYRPGGSVVGLLEGTHSYQITYIRAGDSLPVFEVTGTFYLDSNSTTTVGLTTQFTNGTITSVTAAADGTSLWWTTNAPLSSPKLELLIGGQWLNVTGVLDESGTYVATLPALATGTYQYRITHTVAGRTAAAATGSLSYTAQVSTPVTTLTISPSSDPGTDVGTVAVVSGNTLQWTGSLVGNESGFDLTATLQLQQGGTVLNPTVTFTDSGNVRTFSVSLPTLGAGAWTYTITHLRNGVAVGAATGTVNSTGPGSVRSVSGAGVSAGSAPPTATQITGISANHNGSQVQMAWSATGDTRITSVVQLSTDGVNWGTSYAASLITDESSGAYLFAAALPGTAGTYYYRITNTALGQTLATATGTLQITAGNVINTTTMTIVPTAQDPGTPVGNVSASGATLNWSGSLVGNESGYELTAQIFVQQGGTQYTRTATYTDSGSTRNFSVNLGDLTAGTWNYTISHIRSGVVIGAKAGTFSTSGVSTPRQISSVSVSPNGAIPSPTPVGTLSTSINGSNVTTVSWAAPSVPGTATFEIANQGAGNWQLFNASLVGTEGGYNFTVSFTKPAGTYDYRITLRDGSQVRTVATGTMTITAASSSTSTTATGYTPSAAWAAVGPISASAGTVPQATGSVVSSTTPVWDPVYNESGQQIGTTPRWAGANSVNLSWLTTGGANVNVVVAYRNSTGQDTSTSWNTNAASGGQFTWYDSVPGNGTHGPGGLAYINYVAVYDSAWNLIRYSGYTASNVTLSWGGASGPAPQAYIQYKVAGSSTWSGAIYASLSGSTFSLALQGLADGTYDYSVTQFTDSSSESGGTTSTASGQFVVSGSTAYVASQSGTPSYLSGVSASGSYLYWNYNPQGGDSITVTLNNGAYNLTPVAYGGGNYYASFLGVPSGTYSYSIQYSRAGVAYLLGTGTVGISTTVTPIPATVSASAPSNTLYPIANIVPSASADTLSWSYGAMGGVTTAATLIYSINGGAAQTVNYSGPGSFTFSQVTGNQNATITYEITYRRTDTNAVYAFGSGTYYFTVTTPTINGSLSSVTQADVYPTVPGITNLVDRGGGLMSWDGAASQGGSVQVRYRQPPGSGTWSSWQSATAYGAGYSFNFNALTGWVEYDIQYVVSGQNPYRRAAGQINVVHNSQTIPPDAIESQPSSHAEYAVANVVPTVGSTTSDTLSWSYPTGGVATTVTINYSINGVAQTPLTFSGPGSYSFSSVTGNQSAAIAYTITYRRNDNSMIYAQGTGSFNFTVTTTATNSSLGVASQTAAYPSVPGVANLVDRGSGVMSWDTPSSGGAVEVRYRQPPTSGTWSSWAAASVYGSGFSYNFNGLTGQVEYEIRYVISGQNPYRRAAGFLNVAHSTQVTPASASATAPTNATAITGFSDRGAGNFGWTTAPTDPVNHVRVFRYRAAGATEWVVPARTPTLSGGYWQVYVGDLSGPIEFQVEYLVSGQTVPYAVGGGTINVSTVIDVTGTNFVDTSDPNTVTAEPTLSQEMDRWGNVVSFTDRATQTTHYRYNQAGQLVKTIQPNVSYVDVAGRTEANAGAITSGTTTPTTYNYYDSYGRLAATRDANGNLNTVSYNVAGQIIRENHADGGVKTFLNDIFGQQISITDEKGYRTRQAFDKAGRLTHVAREVTLNAFGATAPDAIPSFLTANVIVNRYEYDLAGRRVAETTGEQMHDVNGNGTGQEQTVRYWYDLHGNMVRMRAITGGEMTFDFDAMGRKIADPGNSKTWTYDYFGHLTAYKDLGGATYSYTYDAGTWLLWQQTNQRGLNQTFDYNAANQLISIVDTGVGRTTEYRYDTAGRRARELITVNGVLHQDTRTEYDELGRISHLSGLGYSVDYEYDAAGNRTHIHAHYSSSFQSGEQNLWYQYDAMNRVTVSQGVNNSGVIDIDTNNSDGVTQGTELYYNERGDRVASVTYGDRIHQSGSTYSTSRGEAGTEYKYDGVGRLTETSIQVWDESGPVSGAVVLVDSRIYDRTSRVTRNTTWHVESSALVKREQNTVYSDDGLAKTQNTYRNDIIESELLYGTATWGGGTESGYDAAGNVKHYEVKVYDNEGDLQYSSYNDFTYDAYETYVQRRHDVTNSAVIQNGATEQRYNVNGELIRFIDEKDHNNDRYFVNNAQGQAITVVKGNYGEYTSPAAQDALHDAVAGEDFFDSTKVGYFFFANDGSYVGSVSGLEGALKANFDVNFTPISSEYPASVPQRYVVQRGDTLRLIAAKVFGDAKLWYVIAEANGLSDPDAVIPEGRELTIPNEVVSLSNDATSFKPFNVADAIGDTTPTQPVIPPRRKGCGVLGMIIVIIVAIVVTYLTWGSTTEFWAGVLNVTANSTAAATASAATAAALGSIASQAVGMAIGVQDKFSWKAVAVAALTTGLTKGLGVDGLNFIGGEGAAADVFNAAIRGAINSAIGQGVNIAVGLQDKFSWRELAISAIAAPAADAIGKSVGLKLDPDFGKRGYHASFSTNLISGVAAGVGSTVVRMALGGKVETQAVIADVFGNALGNALVEGMQARADRREEQRVREIVAEESPTLVTTYNNFVASGGSPDTFLKAVRSDRMRRGLETLAFVDSETDRLAARGIAPAEVWDQRIGGTDSNTFQVDDVDGSSLTVTRGDYFGLATLDALTDLSRGATELKETIPLEEMVMLAQVAVMGPAAFAVDYLRGKVVEAVAGDYLEAGVDTLATFVNGGAHSVDGDTARYLLTQSTEIDARYDEAWAAFERDSAGGQEVNPEVLSNLEQAENLLGYSEEFRRMQEGSRLLAAVIILGTAALRGRRSGPNTQRIYDQPNSHNAGPNAPVYKHWIDEDGRTVHSNLDGSVTYTNRAGVAVTYRNGYPDFAPFMSHPSGVTEVRLVGGFDKKGNRTVDYRRANAEAGHPEWGSRPPENWTWHHVENSDRMQLVPRDVHDEFSHRGGVSDARDP